MGLVRAGAWAAATAAAVSVSWLGVHRVLGDTSYEQPRMLAAAPVTSASSAPPLPTAIASPNRTPTGSATATATATATTTATATPPPARSTGGTPGSGAGGPSGTTGATGATGQIQGYNRPGGRIVVDMGATSASVVTAVADPGWSVHQWYGDDWLRVDFMQGTADSIFYVTWNGHAPSVQTWGP
jgi:hypothetical protein